MKPKLTRALLLSCILGAGTIFAQDNLPTRLWQPQKVGVSIFGDWDVYQNQSLDRMYDHTVRPEEIVRDLSNYEESLQHSTNGAGFQADFTFTKNGVTSPFKHELRFGLGVHLAREGVIDYSATSNNGDTIITNSLIYCNVDNEINLRADYLFSRGRRLQYYFGIGGNLGTTFDESMVLMYNNSKYLDNEDPEDIYSYSDHYQEQFDAKSAIFGRIQVPIGLRLIMFKRVEIASEVRMGVGFQKIVSGKSYFMKNTGQYLMSLRYHFKTKDPVVLQPNYK